MSTHTHTPSVCCVVGVCGSCATKPVCHIVWCLNKCCMWGGWERLCRWRRYSGGCAAGVCGLCVCCGVVELVVHASVWLVQNIYTPVTASTSSALPSPAGAPFCGCACAHAHMYRAAPSRVAHLMVAWGAGSAVRTVLHIRTSIRRSDILRGAAAALPYLRLGCRSVRSCVLQRHTMYETPVGCCCKTYGLRGPVPSLSLQHCRCPMACLMHAISGSLHTVVLCVSHDMVWGWDWVLVGCGMFDAKRGHAHIYTVAVALDCKRM